MSSRTRTPSRPGSPAPVNTNLRKLPGDVLVVAYEGDAMLALSKLTNRFVDLCYVPGTAGSQGYQGVGNFYVKKHFRVTGGSVRHGHQSERAIFTLLAVKMLPTGPLVAGYVQCTVYSRIHGVATQRLVKIDLVCTQGRDPAQRLKGSASILMKELERYAATQLGANMLVLDSVDDPNTWGFYKALGYTRALDQCGGSPRDDAVARAAFKLSRTRQGWSERYTAALDGRYMPAHNIKEDTVFMTKCLRGAKSNPRGVVYPQTSQTAIDALAAFPSPGARVLAVYRSEAPGSSRLVFVPGASAAVPRLFGGAAASVGPRTPSPPPQRRQTRARKASRSPSPSPPPSRRRGRNENNESAARRTRSRTSSPAVLAKAAGRVTAAAAAAAAAPRRSTRLRAVRMSS